MYSRLRTSLKQRTHGQRRTHRQRGGANWAIFDRVRWTKWDTHSDLKNDPDLKFIVDKDLPTLTILEYITIIERQDDLFNYAVRAIANEVGVGELSADQSTDIISVEQKIIKETPGKEAAKSDYFKYLDDIGLLIYFTEPTTGPQTLTKLQQIKKEKLIDLLLYPASVTNIFMNVLAQTCISMRTEKGVLSDLTTGELKYIRAKNYYKTAQKISYDSTGDMLRDGFYPSQNINDFKTLIGTNAADKPTHFWNDFVISCTDIQLIGKINSRNAKRPIPLTPQGTGRAAGIMYSELAAYIFHHYNKKEKDLKSRVLKALCTKNVSDTVKEATLKIEPQLSKYPNFDQLTDVVVPGLTMLQVLQNIDIEQLQFIVHLIYLIESTEKTLNIDSSTIDPVQITPAP